MIVWILFEYLIVPVVVLQCHMRLTASSIVPSSPQSQIGNNHSWEIFQINVSKYFWLFANSNYSSYSSVLIILNGGCPWIIYIWALQWIFMIWQSWKCSQMMLPIHPPLKLCMWISTKNIILNSSPLQSKALFTFFNLFD